MGWLSAIKRVFTGTSKDKASSNEPEKKAAPVTKEKKKWGSAGKSKHGQAISATGTVPFFPLHREPSSIEKILGDAEREIQRENLLPPKRVHRPPGVDRDAEREAQIRSSLDAQHPRRAHPPKASASGGATFVRRPFNPNLMQTSAVRIQAAYKGYMARMNYKALKGLVRLQRAMRGQSVRRQTLNALRCMQILVRVQSQIRARRIQMTESRSFHQHNKSDRDADSTFSKWNSTYLQSELGRQEDWDDSVLTKEELQTRMRRKVEATMKRERALAYACSRQLVKVTPNSKSAYSALAEIKSGGIQIPLWWNWAEKQLPEQLHHHPPDTRTILPPPSTYKKSTSNNQMMVTASTTPRSLNPREPPAETPTTRPGRSSTRLGGHNGALFRAPSATPAPSKPERHRRGSFHLRDDESLTSCPAYSGVPGYMAPTVSAKAKVRNLEMEGLSPAVSVRSKKRFSFGLARWGKGSSTFMAAPTPATAAAKGDAASQKGSVAGGRRRHRSTHSIGSMSIDSTVSLPVGVGRNAFRY